MLCSDKKKKKSAAEYKLFLLNVWTVNVPEMSTQGLTDQTEIVKKIK